MRRGTGRRGVLAGIGAASLIGCGVGGDAAAADFDAWMYDFRARAARAGVAGGTLDRAFRGVRPSERVVELDRQQAGSPGGGKRSTFAGYLARAVNEQRIRGGADRMVAHRATLARVRERTGVAPQVVVALWGIESGYGSFTGSFPVVASLATLAWEGRRRELFEGELLGALRILQRGDVAPESMRGSWAGAMGQCQFMPTTYLAHAVDADGDGRADIWGSVPDVLGSVANYLSAAGWDGGFLWGRRVQAPAGLDPSLLGLERKLALAAWRARGVRRADGGELPPEPIAASLVRPDEGGPAFLVYDNFRTLMVWNRSTYFALAVGHLADAIAAEASAA